MGSAKIDWQTERSASLWMSSVSTGWRPSSRMDSITCYQCMDV